MDTRVWRNDVSALLAQVKYLRKEMGDVTLMRVELLLAVSLEGGLSQRELMDRLDVSRAGMSAAVLNLTEEDALRRPGPGFIAQQVDPEERRRKLVTLTRKGKALLDGAVKVAARSRGRTIN